MDAMWQAEFRRRMSRFAAHPVDGCMPVSVKVRVTSGCFHREHSPQAYRLIDDCIVGCNATESEYQIEEHESGPEILLYLAVTTAGLTFAKSVVDLITAIIKARSEGIRKGDRPSDPLELIVRGHSEDGEYFEEKILRIPFSDSVTPKLVRDALSRWSHQKPEKKAKRK